MGRGDRFVQKRKRKKLSFAEKKNLAEGFKALKSILLPQRRTCFVTPSTRSKSFQEKKRLCEGPPFKTLYNIFLRGRQSLSEEEKGGDVVKSRRLWEAFSNVLLIHLSFFGGYHIIFQTISPPMSKSFLRKSLTPSFFYCRKP